MGTFTIANISVGQHIDAFGMATQGANGAVTLDATAGLVQLDITRLWGTVSAMTTGSLTLNLQSLDGLPASAFSFAGTGTNTAADAVATAYVVNTGALNQTPLTMGAPARLNGFVAPFGMAPPDFTAQSLENFAAVTADLAVSWGKMGAGSATAFTGLTGSSTSLQLNLTGVGNLHFIKIGPELLDLTTLKTGPSIVPDTAAKNVVFTIGHAGKLKTENFDTFAAFITQLATEMGTVDIVVAAGQYDSGTNTLTTQALAVLLSN
jgi:hypothetical protein